MDRDADHLARSGQDGATRVTVYRFATPSVTAGRHAEVEESALARWAAFGHEFARRPTGGGILRHGPEDLAFGAAFGCESGFAGSYLERVSRAARASLAAQGIRTDLPTVSGDQPPCCFQRALGHELLLDGEKLLGLAARRVRGAVLVQGTLVVRRDAALDEALIGVGPRVDLAGRGFDPDAWARDFRSALAAGTETGSG